MLALFRAINQQLLSSVRFQFQFQHGVKSKILQFLKTALISSSQASIYLSISFLCDAHYYRVSSCCCCVINGYHCCTVSARAMTDADCCETTRQSRLFVNVRTTTNGACLCHGLNNTRAHCCDQTKVNKLLLLLYYYPFLCANPDLYHLQLAYLSNTRNKLFSI